jgi:organic radical activating enzyme
VDVEEKNKLKLRYSEAFYSIQGEGKYVGVPSVFLRTFGCNFRCQNFGLERGREKTRYNPEVEKLIEDKVHETTEKFEDLPLVFSGCDTYASIYPEFRHLVMDKTIDDVVDHLVSLTPEGCWTMANGQDVHLILTGGEPLLAWQRLYIELFEHPKMRDLKNVTFETNTTQWLHDEFREYLGTRARFKTTFSCSPKLSVSGESWADAIKPSVARQYYDIAGTELYLKFVVNDAVDVEEVDRAVVEYRAAGVECPVYLMPVGGRTEGYNLTVQQVAKIAMEKGYRFTPRLHITLFGNAWGT